MSFENVAKFKYFGKIVTSNCIHEETADYTERKLPIRGTRGSFSGGKADEA
jgi:hypothetical protein